MDSREAGHFVRSLDCLPPDGYIIEPRQDPNSIDYNPVLDLGWRPAGVLQLTGSDIKMMLDSDQNRLRIVREEEDGKEPETPPCEESTSKNVESQVEAADQPVDTPVEPTVEPSVEPSVEPTIEPKVEPTSEPIVEPNVESTGKPVDEATVEPAVECKVAPVVEATVDPTVDLPSEVSDKDWPDGTLAAGYSLCQNCGIRGQTEKFIRAGKFCSSDCAKSSALTVKSLACGGGSVLTGKTHDSAFHQHRKLNNQLYKPSNKNNSDQASNASLHNDSILRKQRPNNYPIQSTLQSNNLVKESKLNSDSNVDGVTRSQKRSHDSSENHFASKHRGHSSKKSKLKRHALSIRAIESLVHDNNITSLLDSNSITNDSEKLSLPSSPASSLVNITPGSALYQSIFAMKMQQHLAEPPLGWDKHSKNLANIINAIKPSDVLKWNPFKVGEFVNSIPGCARHGQSFLDEVRVDFPHSMCIFSYISLSLPLFR